MPLDEGNIFVFPAIFAENVKNREWNHIVTTMKEMTKKISSDNSGNVTTGILDEVAHVLCVALQELHSEVSEDVLIAVNECFRFLRNGCAFHRDVQRLLHESTIFTHTSDLLNILCGASNCQTIHFCLKTLIQFIGNAIVGNNTNQSIVWKILFPHMIKLLENDDESLVNFICMVLYNILIGELKLVLKFITSNISLILRCYSKSEFATFIIEYLFAKENFLKEIYPELDLENRLQLLNAVWFQLVERENEVKKTENYEIALSNVLFLVDLLKQHADSILSIVEQGISAEPREMLCLVDVVACASSRSQYLSSLQADKSLLICVTCLFKNVNEIGKADKPNVFSSTQRLSEIKSKNEFAQDHPVFGFKASLVRLIGNLCHQHSDNQSQVRELGCLPAILDSCNIDVYNPLLLQWSVLAVRNLLENNSGNQKIVAGLVTQSPASNTVLREFGIELHQDEHGSLNIAPVKLS